MAIYESNCSEMEKNRIPEKRVGNSQFLWKRAQRVDSSTLNSWVTTALTNTIRDLSWISPGCLSVSGYSEWYLVNFKSTLSNDHQDLLENQLNQDVYGCGCPSLRASQSLKGRVKIHLLIIVVVVILTEKTFFRKGQRCQVHAHLVHCSLEAFPTLWNKYFST